MIQRYRDGDSIDMLSHRYKIHRTTVMHHRAHAGIARWRMVRKMTDQSVAAAAARYGAGASLAVVASAFGVDDRTLAREFRRVGVQRLAGRSRHSSPAVQRLPARLCPRRPGGLVSRQNYELADGAAGFHVGVRQ